MNQLKVSFVAVTDRSRTLTLPIEPSIYRPRQLSLGSTAQSSGPLSPNAIVSPSAGAPRSRPNAVFESGMGDPWALAARRRPSDPRSATLSNRVEEKLEGSWRAPSDPRFRDEITEEPGNEPDWDTEPDGQVASSTLGTLLNHNGTHFGAMGGLPEVPTRPLEVYNPHSVFWSYKDHGGQVQGT